MTAGASTILFDLDGTLVDTNYPHVLAWFRAFRQAGKTVGMTAIHRHIGMGSERLLDALAPDRDRARDDVLKAAHAEHYAAFFGLLQPLSGARELVREVARRGGRAVLATSAPPAELRALREALDLDEYVVAVTSAADADAAKPEPDIIQSRLTVPAPTSPAPSWSATPVETSWPRGGPACPVSVCSRAGSAGESSSRRARWPSTTVRGTCWLTWTNPRWVSFSPGSGARVTAGLDGRRARRVVFSRHRRGIDLDGRRAYRPGPRFVRRHGGG